MAKRLDALYKLLLIGDSGVGKTCLISKFADDIFHKDYMTTIGIDFKCKTVWVDEKKLKLQIWDTAGQERFRTITTGFYRGAKGIIMVYDITDVKSFDHISNWIRLIEEFADGDAEMMLVGNKCEMEDKRQVPTVRGEAIAREYGIPFLETSAKFDINVHDVFMDLTKIVLQKAPSKRKEHHGMKLTSRDKSTKCCSSSYRSL